jgi:hypothetical protein
VDVEVDRCIDENSASNLKHRLSLNKASSTKTEDPSINQISDSSQIASRNPNFFLTVTREAPTTDYYIHIYICHPLPNQLQVRFLIITKVYIYKQVVLIIPAGIIINIVNYEGIK